MTIHYAKILNELGQCEVGIGSNFKFYESIGMTQLDVEQSDIDNNWYLKELCPHKSKEDKEREKHERILKLSVTKSDFFDATIKAFGLDDTDLLPIVSNIIAQVEVPEVMKKIAINNFKNAKDFYRNHEIFNVLAGKPIVINEQLTITITSEQFDKYFDKASQHDADAYKELLPEVENNNEL